MSYTTNSHDVRLSGSTGRNLDEKFRRVVLRSGRLNRLVAMRAPDIVVRNEKRLLKAAVDNLFDDPEVEAIISRIGAKAFTDSFNRITGKVIFPPPAKTERLSLAA